MRRSPQVREVAREARRIYRDSGWRVRTREQRGTGRRPIHRAALLLHDAGRPHRAHHRRRRHRQCGQRLHRAAAADRSPPSNASARHRTRHAASISPKSCSWPRSPSPSGSRWVPSAPAIAAGDLRRYDPAAAQRRASSSSRWRSRGALRLPGRDRLSPVAAGAHAARAGLGPVPPSSR